jgi:hypothetical protein
LKLCECGQNCGNTSHYLKIKVNGFRKKVARNVDEGNQIIHVTLLEFGQKIETSQLFQQREFNIKNC